MPVEMSWHKHLVWFYIQCPLSLFVLKSILNTKYSKDTEELQKNNLQYQL